MRPCALPNPAVVRTPRNRTPRDEGGPHPRTEERPTGRRARQTCRSVRERCPTRRRQRSGTDRSAAGAVLARSPRPASRFRSDDRQECTSGPAWAAHLLPGVWPPATGCGWGRRPATTHGGRRVGCRGRRRVAAGSSGLGAADGSGGECAAAGAAQDEGLRESSMSGRAGCMDEAGPRTPGGCGDPAQGWTRVGARPVERTGRDACEARRVHESGRTRSPVGARALRVHRPGDTREGPGGGEVRGPYETRGETRARVRPRARSGAPGQERWMNFSGIGVPLRHRFPSARSKARGRSRTSPPPGLWVISPK